MVLYNNLVGENMSLEEVVEEVKIKEKEVRNILNYFDKTPYFCYLSKEESMKREEGRVEIQLSSKSVDKLDFDNIIQSLKGGYSLDILVDHSKKGNLVSISYRDNNFILTYHKDFADILKEKNIQEDLEYVNTLLEKYK